MEVIYMECFKKQISLIYIEGFLDKQDKILQNAWHIHQDDNTKFGLEEWNPVKNIFAAKANKHENFHT